MAGDASMARYKSFTRRMGMTSNIRTCVAARGGKLCEAIISMNQQCGIDDSKKNKARCVFNCSSASSFFLTRRADPSHRSAIPSVAEKSGVDNGAPSFRCRLVLVPPSTTGAYNVGVSCAITSWTASARCRVETFKHIRSTPTR